MSDDHGLVTGMSDDNGLTDVIIRKSVVEDLMGLTRLQGIVIKIFGRDFVLMPAEAYDEVTQLAGMKRAPLK